MRPLARVLFDESHRQAWSTRPLVAERMNPGNPADASFHEAAHSLATTGFKVSVHAVGPLDQIALGQADVLVLPHCSVDAFEATTGEGSPVYDAAEIAAIEEFVRTGGGLVLLAETEQDKYGNSFAEIAERFGVSIVNATMQDPVNRLRGVSTWVLAEPLHGEHADLTAGVRELAFYRAGALELIPDHQDQAFVVARSHATATPAQAPLLVAVEAGAGRVVVSADSDLFGDDTINDLDNRLLWRNLVTWTVAGPGSAGTRRTAKAPVLASPAWQALVDAVEQLRPLQAKDGSVAAEHHAEAAAATATMIASVEELAPLFPHQLDHLSATVTDLRRWADGGFGVPDFLDSLRLFRPELARSNGMEHLVLFPMYTQNGNPNRNFEAVVTRTVWPEWIAALEAGAYDNAAFVPIEFVGATAGYDTHSAVLFPETVATRETLRFTWGGIFCDREAARFRRVSRAAAETLRFSLPPDAEQLLNDQSLAQETFILWDLVHDRTHSHGDLPFDPFMIKQRMPYWMYGLEELRCDLSTYRETAALEADGVVLARHVRYAILFDRLFRFPTTGERVRNYDGLAGQIMFAWLHKQGVLHWTDNTFSIDWDTVSAKVVELTEAVEKLYNDGIDRSRMGHWLAAHEFVSALVPPNPASTWAQGARALGAEPKAAVDAVLPDEFPLNVFYEALRKKLAPVIDSTRGITGASA